MTAGGLCGGLQDTRRHAALRAFRYNTTLVGDGTTVVKQVPEAGMEFGCGTVILYRTKPPYDKVEVPDVRA